MPTITKPPAPLAGFNIAAHTPHQRMGTLIQMARVSQGLSRTQLGQKVGVCREAVRLWELGKRVPDGVMVKRIADSLNQDVHLFWS